MRQVLFHVPFLKDAFPPDGYGVSSFGAMLFVTFVVVTWWGTRRAGVVGVGPEKFQDLAIWLFVSGIIGARLLYMVQYSHEFPSTIGDRVLAFFQIWNGGIIFYGSAFGGAFGYGLFYWFVLRKLRVNGWQLADVVAPLLALGLAIGRIGCYLNGCCWGQVACEETCPVPLGAAHFPLLPAHARGLLVGEQKLQTSTGFALAPRDGGRPTDDPRSVLAAVEGGSPAAVVGLRAGDRVVRVDGEPNAIVLEVSGSADKVRDVLRTLLKRGGVAIETTVPKSSRWPWSAKFETRTVSDPAADIDPAAVLAVAGDEPPPDWRSPAAVFDTLETYVQARIALTDAGLDRGVSLTPKDRLSERVRYWPRGRSELELAVLRDGKEVGLPPFAPVTVGLYPTQLYETVSMVLLIALLLAFHPFRRHDGQLFSLLLFAYAVHRFVNESLRIEPTVGGTPLTMSQWGSVLIFAIGVVLETFLWLTMASRWKAKPSGDQPPSASPGGSTGVAPG